MFLNLTWITLISTSTLKPCLHNVDTDQLSYIDINYVKKHISGHLMNVFFLGNEHLHHLTAQGKYNLRINLEDFDNNEKYATHVVYFILL
jgi:hypothetical protein